MKTISLKYVDPKLESIYQITNKPFVINTLYFCFKLEMVFCLLMMAVHLVNLGFTIFRLISFIAIIIFFLIFFIIKRCVKSSVFEFFLIIVCFAIGIILTEIINGAKIKVDQVPISCVFVGATIQFFLNLTLLTRISWFYSSIGYFINILYMNFRLVQSFNEIENIIVGSSLLILGFPLISYRHEKTYREYFKKLHDSNVALGKFKEIIQSVISGPIFILNYEKNQVEFMNKKATKLLMKDKVKTQTKRQITLNDENLLISPDDKKLQSIEIIEEVFKKYKILNGGNSLSFAFEEINLPDVIKNFFNFKTHKEIPTKYQQLIDEDFVNLHIIDDRGIKKEENNNNESKCSKMKFYELQITTLDWDNKPCIIIIFHNQTKARKVIELMNQDEYKNQMLATISHDLRTPLNGIMGIISSVYTSIKDDVLKKTLKVAITSANLLNYLISDILDFTQITYKRLRINVERIDLNELVKEIYKMMKFQAKKKKIDFHKEIELNDHRILYSDPLRIKQILLNLLGNALKFTKEGGNITLKVERVKESDLEKKEEIEEVVKFSVIDSGIGIRDEDRSKLFVLFGKLNIADAEINKTGIGFGLTISMNLAKMLYFGPDAGIILKSKIGKGSSFSFKVSSQKKNENFSKHMIDENKILMPYHEFSPKPNILNERNINNIYTYSNLQTVERINSSNTHENFIPFKILIVDDDPINLMILEKYLEHFKIEFYTALNGAEAFEIVQNDVLQKKNEIKIILMDCNMPVMNGFQASEKINEFLEHKKLEEIPIVAVTANVTHSDMNKCLESGMKKFLAKPVSRYDLGMLIEKLLNINLNL